MYSRNTWEKKSSGYTVPPGYDGSRFRRRRRHGGSDSEDEVILIPDSGFAPAEETTSESSELSVGGIPTQKGIRNRRRNTAYAENTEELSPASEPEGEPSRTAEDETHETQHPAKSEKLSGLLDKLGFGGGMSPDELLLCAIIFIIASDTENNGRNVGDILLILALLLGIR